jgi:tetratricopeptide (TPR) repeat protein
MRKRINCILIVVIILCSCNDVSNENFVRADENIKIGKELLDKEDYENALTYFNKALDYNPNNAVAYYYRALVYMDKEEEGSMDSVISNCLRAIAIESSFDSAYVVLIGPYAEKNGRIEALNLLNLAISSNPNSAALFLLRGIFKYGLGDYNSAILDLEKSIALNPNEDSYTYLFLGKAQFRCHNYDAGIVTLNKSIQIDSNELESYFWRGACNSKLDKSREAINDYTLYINVVDTIFGMRMQAHQNRGIEYSKIGMNDSACKDLTASYKLGSIDALNIAKQFCFK